MEKQLLLLVKERKWTDNSVIYVLAIPGLPSGVTGWWEGAHFTKEDAKKDAVKEVLDYVDNDNENLKIVKDFIQKYILISN